MISAGPNVFVYFVDSAEPLPIERIEVRYPRLAENISRSRGVGVALARSAAGPVCNGSPDGDVSFIPELGAHDGPGPDELHTFIVHPADIRVPSPLVHPIQLYDHFIRYRLDAREEAA